MKKYMLFAGVVFLCQCIFADNPVVDSRGIGTKALSLGNSFVGVADDFTAIYWNPAGLAFAPVREFQISLDYLNNTMKSDFDGEKEDLSRQRIHFGHAGLMRSIPSSRGGFSFAVGFTSPVVLDNIYSFRGWDQYLGIQPRQGIYTVDFDTVITIDTANDTTMELYPVYDSLNHKEWLFSDTAKNRVYGQMNMVSASAGWQISTGLGFGVTVSAIVGREHQEIRTITYKGDSTLFEDSREEIRRSYTGIDLRAGFLFKPIEWMNLGISIYLPQYIRFEEVYQFQEKAVGYLFPKEYYNGTLKSSFGGAIGSAFKLPFMLIAAQANFRAPVTEAAEGSDRAFWKVGLSGGIEVPIPVLSTMLRAGYSWNELDIQPFEVIWDGAAVSAEPSLVSEKGTHMICGGIAFLFSDFLSIETAYSFTLREYSVVEQDWRNPIIENHRNHRVQCSFSIHY